MLMISDADTRLYGRVVGHHCSYYQRNAAYCHDKICRRLMLRHYYAAYVSLDTRYACRRYAADIATVVNVTSPVPPLRR